MKLNNKGFTVVELLASFSLMMVVTMFLFEVVMELKNIYVSSSLETRVKNENALIARAINDLVEPGVSVSCTSSSNNCTVNGSKIEVMSSNVLVVGNQSFTMPEDATIDSVDFNIGEASGFLKISYRVYGTEFREGIPFKLVLDY